MNGLRFLCVVVLLGLSYAQYDGPYASFTAYWYNGCDSVADNYVYSLYLYPADGSCFSPSGGLSPLHGYRITYNETTIAVSTFYNPDCTGTYYGEEYYLRDACTIYTLASIYQTLPPNQYWANQGFVGYSGRWDTVLVTAYYSSVGCNSFTDIEIQGWPECSYGYTIYCQSNQLHWDYCIDPATCPSGCVPAYAPLGNTCTATSNTPDGWSSYVNIDSVSYQASCAAALAPTPPASPSSSPSTFPTPSESLPPSESSSSDDPADGMWVLLMIICLLVGIIVGLLLGLVIYGKLNAKKAAEVNNGYIQLPPYGIQMPYFAPPQQ